MLVQYYIEIVFDDIPKDQYDTIYEIFRLENFEKFKNESIEVFTVPKLVMEKFHIINPSLRIIDFEGLLTVSIFFEGKDLHLQDLNKEGFFRYLGEISSHISAGTYCIGMDQRVMKVKGL